MCAFYPHHHVLPVGQIDDCWMQKDPPRVDGRLVPDPTRFPSGFSALAEYVHSKNVRFGVYTAESPTTCAGYPASATHEAVDAESFASWDVDYVKVDGCGDQQYYPTGYPAMGKALAASGRNITYSCSWPAYLGSNETAKPFDEFIAAGCNLWCVHSCVWRRWVLVACCMLHVLISCLVVAGATGTTFSAPGAPWFPLSTTGCVARRCSRLLSRVFTCDAGCVSGRLRRHVAKVCGPQPLQ